ncbi:MAG TPA: sigma-E factor negative regulatory protein [Burkholderiaceae bacterium]|nr:sigma-E factor negative regulatory protein [Burkholderiaceae bacterium]
MNIRNMTHEQISAFADSELPDEEIDAALAAARTSNGRVTWDLYHQIGDTLRSSDMAFEMRPDFSARLMMRLEQEPAIVAPVTVPDSKRHGHTGSATSAVHPGKRRLMLQGIAAALAITTLALIAAPQIMTTMKGVPTGNASNAVASATQSSSSAPDNLRVAVRQEDVLRDPGIDEYLLAHQRFSPSVYSTAQYARSATFATDSDK